MEKTVHKYITELATESKCRLTRHFAGEVEEFAFLLGKTITILQNYNKSNVLTPDKTPKSEAYNIMLKGTNALMAGFELVTGGYLWEPPILFRNALEGFASAWDIVHNPKRFELWVKEKKFNSTDSISNLKKSIEPVGQMYGFLSNMYTHLSPINATPPLIESDGVPKPQFFGQIPVGKENIRVGEVYFALMVAYICLQLTELTFHQYSPELETIEKIPGEDFVKVKVSDRHRKFVNAAMKHFQSMVDDPESFI